MLNLNLFHEYKQCKRCQNNLVCNDDNFCRSSNKNKTLSNICKDCRREQRKTYRLKNIEKVKSSDAKYNGIRSATDKIKRKESRKLWHFQKIECKECKITFDFNHDNFEFKDTTCKIPKICITCKNKRKKIYYNKRKKNIFNDLVPEGNRQCSICKIVYPYTSSKRARTLIKECQSCKNEKKRQDYLKNKERYLDRAKKYIEENREIVRERQKNFRSRKESKEKKYKNFKEKIKTDVNFRVSINLRARIRKAINSGGTTKSLKTEELIGCTLNFLISYLESKFQEGMTWENYGNNGWVVDHIIPVYSFNLLDIEQQKICFHYTNMQPLSWIENLSKGSKLDWIKA